MFYHLISDSSEDICEGQPIFSRQLHICIEHPETYELVEKEGVLEVLTVWQYLQEHPISDSATCRKPQMRDTYILLGVQVHRMQSLTILFSSYTNSCKFSKYRPSPNIATFLEYTMYYVINNTVKVRIYFPPSSS